MFTVHDKVKRFWGREFRIVKNGLDEAEVADFVESLLDQRSYLAEKLEHLDSLKKLAEKVLIEAEEQAQAIRTEAARQMGAKARTVMVKAREKAKARGNRIAARAEERATAEAERVVAEAQHRGEEEARQRVSAAEQQAQEIMSTAEEEAQAARARAEEESAALVTEARQKVDAAELKAQELMNQAEDEAAAIRTPAEGEAAAILAGAREKAEAAERQAQQLTQEAVDTVEAIRRLAEEEASRLVAEARKEVEALVEARAAKAEEDAQRILGEATENAAAEALRIRDEAEQLLRKNERLAEEDVMRKFRRVLEGFLASSGDMGGAAGAPGERWRQTADSRASVPHARPEAAGARPEWQPSDQGDEEGGEGPTLYNGPVEVVIPPPVALNQMLKLHKRLAKTPQVQVLDVKGSADKGIVMKLHLRGQIPFVEILRALPEVEEITGEFRDAGRTSSTRNGRNSVPVPRIVVTIAR